MNRRSPENKELGKRGERLAVDYLKKKGYRIVETNYRTRKGEIDIVCEHRDCVVFVEVKTRRSLAFGEPEEAVNSRKRKRMLLTATRYLTEKYRPDKVDCRFDVITILEDGKRTLKHIEDAFRP
jgi:putative endonuclease